MATIDDVIQAKNEISRRHLRSQARWRREPKSRSLTVADVRKDAARNLHAVGVGYKIVEGKQTRTLCVRLYVLQKLASSLVVRSARLPSRIAGLPTDVIEAPQMGFQVLCTKIRRRPVAPLIGGVSAAHRNVHLGTLGAFCSSLLPNEANATLMLSCNHTFANLNGTSRGAPIVQPSPGDGGRLAIGTLKRWIPLNLDGTTPNLVDAAVGEVSAGTEVIREICSIGAIRGVTPPILNMKVKKHGRTTGYTEGIITDPSMDNYVYGFPPVGAGLFMNGIRTEVIPGQGYMPPTSEIMWNDWFCAPGDSGSVIVDKASNRAVGLHFAGDYGISVSSPMVTVCQLLRISMP